VQEKQTLKVDRTYPFSHFVCQGGERERQEIRGCGYSEVVQVMGSRKGIKFERKQRCMRKKQGKEWR
jgi:hypothetical protein